ncbi:MAG: hypothetical protein Q8891_17125 [Bacteroidota bacterium]|nr:hypothetical protein [Bacteroidota bacterium]
MERVETLLKKLQQQLEAKSPIQVMLHTVQILQAELMNHLAKRPSQGNQKISVIMPVVFDLQPGTDNDFADSSIQEEKVIEVLQVDEKEIEEELKQIKKNAEAVNAMGLHQNIAFNYDPIEEVPTLSHQDQTPADYSIKDELPFEYPESLNDRLKEEKIELSHSLTTSPIKDLKKAIGVNDRFVFINELFRGDEAMYERSIKTIQNFSIFAEAEYWIKRELKLKLGWLDSHPVVKEFDQLIRRRFS